MLIIVVHVLVTLYLSVGLQKWNLRAAPFLEIERKYCTQPNHAPCVLSAMMNVMYVTRVVPIYKEYVTPV